MQPHRPQDDDRTLATPMPLVGRVVGGHYTIGPELGRGGFGAVHRAVQAPLGRPVAVKLMRPERAEDGTSRARFFQEARIAARISHPGVVTLYDYGEEPDGLLYAVFELVDGVDLRTLLDREGRRPMEPARAAHLMAQVLEALAAAHRAKAIHRDLKPANIMVVDTDAGERARILDFGLARSLAEEGDHTALNTRRGFVMGTPKYMAPEQIMDGAIDGRADLYAVGVLLFEMLAGRAPYDCPRAIDTLAAHRRAPVPRLSDGVPEALRRVVRRALAKRPEDRFADALEMAEALRVAVADGEAEVSGFAETEEMAALQVEGPARRRPAGALARVLAAACLCVVALTGSSREPEPPVDAPPVVITVGDLPSTAHSSIP